MKTYIRSLTAAAAVAMALGTAPALSAQTLDAVATIPFAFTAGNTTLPRGTYNVSTLPNHTDVLLIRGLETGLILLSQPAGAGVDRSAGLVFDHFENQYFLREIRLGGSARFTLPKSARENAAAERLSSSATPETIVVRTAQ